MQQPSAERARPTRTLPLVLLATLVATDALVGMEWLFQVTRPSVLSGTSWSDRISTLFTAPLPLLAVGCVVVLLLWTTGRLVPQERWSRVLRAGSEVPAVILWTFLLLLLVDNFSNTLFGFGIQKTTGLFRGVAAGLVLLLAAFGLRLQRGMLRVIARRRRATGTAGLLATALGVFLLGSTWLRGEVRRVDAAEVLGALPEPARRPNILLISSDGVDADHMSLYGYARDTTPFLDSIAADGLLCENAFANCARTTGSVTSILTGRLPTATGVVFPPDRLQGADAFRHLPGILRRLGYRTWHMSIRHFADTFDLDFRDAFDQSTFQSLPPVRLVGVLGEPAGPFVARLVTRLRDRVGHLLGRTGTPAAFVEVQGTADSGELPDTDRVLYADRTRIDALVDFLRRTDRPFFAHVHLMTTHGARFPVTRKVFSQGQQQHSTWMVDFYDDAIGEFDAHLRRVFATLDEQGLRDDTLVIVHSDHGLSQDNLKRIPLFFLFPGTENAGRLRHNVQNLDIAPTILDYLGIPRPEWMTGTSLLRGEPPPLRPLFSADADEEAFVHRHLRAFLPPSRLEPPFYSLRKLTMILCHRSYTVDVLRRDLAFGDVAGHTQPCDPEALPTPQQAFVRILGFLRQSGYDVSSFAAPAGAAAPQR